MPASDPPTDPSPDVSPDDSPDASPDDSPDASPDDSPDASPDDSPDASPDDSPDASPGGEGGSLNYALDGEITFLTPANSDVPTSEAIQWLYDGLYTYDASLTPVPSLAAAEADISEDGLTWTVSLVENAMFMPGEIPLTAADVVFTYEMANSPNCRFNPSICLAFITVTPEGAEEPVPVLQNVEALDDFTVEFTLASPYAPFATSVLPMFIIPQSATEESFARFQEGAENVASEEIADLQARIAEDAGTEEEPNENADPVQFRAEIEAILTEAGLELPDQALYPALDETTGEPIEGQLDEGAYTGALITQLGDLATTLESEAAEQVAAAYPLLDIQRNPVGAGPFYMTEFSPGTSLTYAANPNYHKGEPQISTMNLPIIKNTTALGTSLLAGDVDWIYTVAPDVLPQVQADPNI
ncbi:MAG: ABC transporter substrate-binding protein, partial [Chloroflexota bacterium]|nr:ABC transporter substrate-binding protein [Chloroflexota bacterium]